MDHTQPDPGEEDSAPGAGADAGGRSVSGQPHDGLFRAVFGRAEHAASELRSVLPPGVVAELDLDALRPVPGSFVDASLRQHHTDVLFTTTWRGREAYIYVLIEHQSHCDPWMALRMLSYLVRIWERHRDEHPDQAVLPLIIPLVVHQGPGHWSAATDLADLFDLDGAGGSAIRGDGLVPRVRYLVDDLGGLDPERLRARPLTGAATIALLVLARARVDPDIAEVLAQWPQELRDLVAGVDGDDVLVAVLTYLWRVTEAPERRLFELAASISPRAEEVAMTTAEKLRREGEARGRAEGEARGRAAMLVELLTLKFGPLDDHVRDRLATATPEQISAWSTRLVGGATSIDEVLDN